MRLYLLFFVFLAIQARGQTVKLSGLWKFHVGDEQVWSAPDYNDERWEDIHVLSAWEDEGFNGYDGFAWYRKKFNGNSLNEDQQYYLNLGFIDDCDVVYFNGYAIGLSGSMPPKFKTAYNSERKYSIPADLINYHGDNLIAVRVFDVTISGGIVDGEIGIYNAPNNHLLVDLQGLWDLAKVKNERRVEDVAAWQKVMVPAPWEHQGLLKYDGYAWYRKAFRVPNPLPDENLILLAGKIDDFDKVYLNGKMIGTTNDGRSLGRSESYRQLRVYKIPRSILKKDGDNILEVFVEDMGIDGGIYEGPVGIIRQSDYERYYRTPH
jgi:sialate O-acetylesterase